MNSETSGPVVLVFPNEIEAELRRFCRRVCTTPANVATFNGLGVAVTVDRTDAPAVEAAADVIASWKSDGRRWLAKFLSDPATPKLSACHDRGLADRLDTVARRHAERTDSLQRFWAEEIAEPSADRECRAANGAAVFVPAVGNGIISKSPVAMAARAN